MPDLTDSPSLREALRQLLDRMPTVVTLALVFLLAWLVSRATGKLVRRLRDFGHFTPVMAERIQNIRRWVVWSVAVLAVLQTTGMFSHAWALLSAGLAAVAIGFFAAWSLISNLTSALLILALRPFRLGDYVELVEPNNGTSIGGEVIDMNLMFTVIAERDRETGFFSRTLDAGFRAARVEWRPAQAVIDFQNAGLLTIHNQPGLVCQAAFQFRNRRALPSGYLGEHRFGSQRNCHVRCSRIERDQLTRPKGIMMT